MKARVTSVRLGGIDASAWIPPDPASWEVVAKVDLVYDGDADPATHGYTITVCNLRWLEDTVRANGPLAGGRRIVVDRWVPEAFAGWCRDTIEALEAPTGDELLTLVGRHLVPAVPPMKREFVFDSPEELRSVHCSDVWDLESWRPDDPYDFSLVMKYIVGLVDDIGEDWFDLTVCTPRWIARRLADTGIVFDARYHLIVDHWDWDESERFIRDAIPSATGSVSPHARGELGHWEDEGYVEGDVPLVSGELIQFLDALPAGGFRCPVCGYPDLTEAPRVPGSGGSYEICPSCGFEFGYTDEDQGISDVEWREQWKAAGSRWSALSVEPPDGWDPAAQLRNVEK